MAHQTKNFFKAGEKSSRIEVVKGMANHFRICESAQGWISDMGIDGPTFVPKSGYFLLIWVKVCPQKLAFS